MKRYFVYACESMYGGHHGMNSMGVYDVEDWQTKEDVYQEYVPCMSFDVMQSYHIIMEDLVDRDSFDNEDEYYEALEEAMNENVDGYVVQIRDDVTLSTVELDNICNTIGEEEFIEEYCVK